MNETTNIQYKGKVTVLVKRGDKVISTTTSHNAGTSVLFRFLANALAGNYATAENYRPVYIEARHKPSSGSSTSVSAKVYYSSAPTVASTTYTTTEGTDANTYSTTLHFLIPATTLTQSGNVTINQFYLYCTGDDDRVAEYDLETDISITANTNYSIAVEWEMLTKNA